MPLTRPAVFTRNFFLLLHSSGQRILVLFVPIVPFESNVNKAVFFYCLFFVLFLLKLQLHVHIFKHFARFSEQVLDNVAIDDNGKVTSLISCIL